MRLTKEQLKQIIKEELEAVMTEGPLYGPTGETRVLNPNDESDYEEFAKSGIHDPKAVAAKRLEDMGIPKPAGNYQWSFVVNLKSGRGIWGWQKMDNTRDTAAAPGPEEEDVRQTVDKYLARLKGK